MMPDDSKYYVANFLDSTISVINTVTGVVTKTIPLLANYDPISGAVTGPVGALPIQTPVSPDGKVMVTATILTDSITIVDTKSDTLVASLSCDAGCHGGGPFGVRIPMCKGDALINPIPCSFAKGVSKSSISVMSRL